MLNLGVTESLRHLLGGSIDYAGLFPPAALPMDEAVDEYRGLQKSTDRWIVNRFISPVAWLPDFLVHLKQTAPNDPWKLSVLGTSIEGFKQDLRLIEAFEADAKGLVDIEAYEVKSNGQDLTPGALRHLVDAGFDEVYIELPWGEPMMEGVLILAETEVIGAKARTGGLEATSFPSAMALAAFIQECVNLDLPFKLTAGLHHPLPRIDFPTGATMHGFINVFIAGTLAYVHDLSRQEIERILSAENKEEFWFSDGGLGWRDFEASNQEIDEFRQQFGSYGSCSVREPLEDLDALGWLGAKA